MTSVTNRTRAVSIPTPRAATSSSRVSVDGEREPGPADEGERDEYGGEQRVDPDGVRIVRDAGETFGPARDRER